MKTFVSTSGGKMIKENKGWDTVYGSIIDTKEKNRMS